jgi:hypothetical protein
MCRARRCLRNRVPSGCSSSIVFLIHRRKSTNGKTFSVESQLIRASLAVATQLEVTGVAR